MMIEDTAMGDTQSIELDQQSLRFVYFDTLDQVNQEVQQIACAVQRLQQTLDQMRQIVMLPSPAGVSAPRSEAAYLLSLLDTGEE